MTSFHKFLFFCILGLYSTGVNAQTKTLTISMDIKDFISWHVARPINDLIDVSFSQEDLMLLRYNCEDSLSFQNLLAAIKIAQGNLE